MTTYKTLGLISIVFAFILAGCKSPMEKALENIADLEKSFNPDSAVISNRSYAKSLAAAYAFFALSFPEDDRSSDYLFKAGEISNSIMEPDSALKYFKIFYDRYPDHKKAALSLFLEGFIYETQKGDLNMARESYTAFLDKYPGHDLAKDVKFSLDYLGLSDEELIKILESQNGSEYNEPPASASN